MKPTTAIRTRTITEYRVTSEREGNQVTVKKLRSLRAVSDRIGILTSPEPWRFFGKPHQRSRDGNAFVCCAGTTYDECACGGITLAQDTAERRKDLPPIVSVKVEARRITYESWQAVETPTVGEVRERQAPR